MILDIASRIQAFPDLAPNWDGEGAPAIDAVAIATAVELLQSILGVAMRRHVMWHDPTVAPDPGGGVDLHFAIPGSWLLLTVEPGATALIQMTAQREGCSARHWRGSLSEAAEEVCSLFRPAEVFSPR